MTDVPRIDTVERSILHRGAVKLRNAYIGHYVCLAAQLDLHPGSPCTVAHNQEAVFVRRVLPVAELQLREHSGVDMTNR